MGTHAIWPRSPDLIRTPFCEVLYLYLEPGLTCKPSRNAPGQLPVSLGPDHGSLCMLHTSSRWQCRFSIWCPHQSAPALQGWSTVSSEGGVDGLCWGCTLWEKNSERSFEVHVMVSFKGKERDRIGARGASQGWHSSWAGEQWSPRAGASGDPHSRRGRHRGAFRSGCTYMSRSPVANTHINPSHPQHWAACLDDSPRGTSRYFIGRDLSCGNS